MKKPALNSVSLWECLGVLAILGTLTAVLLPVVARARTAASDSSLTQWKHLHTALGMYAADYGDAVPALPNGDRLRRLRTGLYETRTSGARMHTVSASLMSGAPGDCILNDGSFNSQDGGCRDLAPGGLVWSLPSHDAQSLNPNFPTAVNYCANLVEGGYSDWRLPTRAELETVGLRDGASHLAGEYIPIGSRWSSTTKGNKAYSVRLHAGSPWFTTYLSTQKTSFIDASCVRTP